MASNETADQLAKQASCVKSVGRLHDLHQVLSFTWIINFNLQWEWWRHQGC